MIPLMYFTMLTWYNNYVPIDALNYEIAKVVIWVLSYNMYTSPIGNFIALVVWTNMARQWEDGIVVYNDYAFQT